VVVERLTIFSIFFDKPKKEFRFNFRTRYKVSFTLESLLLPSLIEVQTRRERNFHSLFLSLSLSPSLPHTRPFPLFLSHSRFSSLTHKQSFLNSHFPLPFTQSLSLSLNCLFPSNGYKNNRLSSSYPFSVCVPLLLSLSLGQTHSHTREHSLSHTLPSFSLLSPGVRTAGTALWLLPEQPGRNFTKLFGIFYAQLAIITSEIDLQSHSIAQTLLVLQLILLHD